jgi:transglutaminase-like putative cysteine protease
MTYFFIKLSKTKHVHHEKLRFHKTTYTFDRSVKLFPCFRLRPAHSRTAIEGYTFKISPENHFINWQQDPFGNYQARIVLDKIKELTVEVEVIAKLQVINPFDYFVEEYAEEFPFTYDCFSKN